MNSSLPYPTINPTSLPQVLPNRELASFWRRLGAFLLDSLIVGVVAFLVTIPFFDLLSRLGAWGRLLGVGLALPYYAILNSEIGRGQTVGKRALHIQVVDVDGHPPSFAKSLLRYLTLAVPYFLSDIPLSVTRTPQFVSYLLSALGIISLATLYLVAFNRETRQGIHDLVAGTYVARADIPLPPDKKAIWWAHWLILASLIVVGYLASWLIGRKMGDWAPITDLKNDIRIVERLNGVNAAGATIQNFLSVGKTDTKTTLIITVKWTGDVASKESFADHIAKAILTNDPLSNKYDAIRIVLVRGYDLGITSSRSSVSFEHSPAEWAAR